VSPSRMFHVPLSRSLIRSDDLCYFDLPIRLDDYDLINRGVDDSHSF
jgi:hypothetical protein